MNILLVTLDTCRYDTTQLAYLPNFEKLIEKSKKKDGWVKCYSHGTFTLPSHKAMFLAGKFPSDKYNPYPFGRRKGMFKFMKKNDLVVAENNEPHFLFENEHGLLISPDFYRSVPDFFYKKGYNVFGVGSVAWFNLSRPNVANIWLNMFHNNFIYNRDTANTNPKSFENQIKLVKEEVTKKGDMNHFLFVNVGSMHSPYCDFGDDHEAQIEALEYVDSHILELIDSIPKPLIVKMYGDHGECFGEDDMYGHSFYHPKVMEVPGLYLYLE